MQDLSLIITKHPNKEAEDYYKNLIGIEYQKDSLLSTLSVILDKDKINRWKKKHHQNSLNIINQLNARTPLVILSGEVGCGKSALAQTIATPLSKILGRSIITFTTPSNIRGSGLVGELSNRITETFLIIKGKLVNENLGIVIIDEADDLATSRAQNQAHHEDRAGLNVLVKQIDILQNEKNNLAVILITNRLNVLDPAIRRRAMLTLKFGRPTNGKLKEVFEYIFKGSSYDEKEITDLVEIASNKKIAYSYSDLIQRVGFRTLFKSIDNDKPFSIKAYKEALINTEPSPLIEETTITNMNSG